MVADNFGDIRICETRILGDYGLLMVLAVKDKSCRKNVRNQARIQVSGNGKEETHDARRKWV